MLKNIAILFHKKRKAIEDELSIKSKVDKILTGFVKEEVLKNKDIDYKLSYTIRKGVIKIEIDNKLIAQEIALRIRGIEKSLKDSGIIFQKLLI